MKKNILLLTALAVLFFACTHEHTHGHEAEEEGPEPISHTLYAGHTELFVEFLPPVVGVESRFAAHFTVLGERFEALREASVQVELTVGGTTVSGRADAPEVPGIFRLRLTPTAPGMGRLVFRVRTAAYEDVLVVDSVKVYADSQTALAENPHQEGSGGDISYTKEQAWKVDFAHEVVARRPFSDIIKATGQLLSAPGDEAVVAAKTAGIVRFAGPQAIVGSAVSAGARLFTVSSGDLPVGNLDAALQDATARLEKTRADYERTAALVKDKLIPEREFLEAKLRYEEAQNALATLSKNHTAAGHTVSAPMDGFLKGLLVTEGQFVEAGTPLAVISRNRKLLLQANVSQKYFDRLPAIASANFRAVNGERFYATSELNGRVVSYGKSTTAGSPFIPISFELDNTVGLIPGAVVEVFLQTGPVPDALVLPVSALLEEQGSFFVYVQTEGESFQKREVKLGASDGPRVQILAGIAEGERVVTKGAFQIKLSQASGTMPAHGHVH